jgi:DNA polymerase-3 subunit delta'
MAHPDLDVLLPEEGHKDILIDQVRELQHHLALAPYIASYRVALLPDSQRATTQAMNALLKTLEEPADKVLLMLTADALESLLPTIVSRCEVIRLRPAALNDTRDFLQSSQGFSNFQAELIAHLSSGRVGTAIEMAKDPEILTHRKESLTEFLNLLSAPRYERFTLAKGLSKPYDKAREKVGEVLPIWLSFWRDVFVRSSGSDLPLVNIDFENQINQMAVQMGPQTARSLVIAHEKAFQQLDAYANVRLLVETLMLRWPYVQLTE